VPTWILEAFNTDSRYPDDVRYRDYTTSARKAEAFERIPKIQFSDSGRGIVFRAVELAPKTRRLPKILGLREHIEEHLKVEKPRSGQTLEQKAAAILAGRRLRVSRVDDGWVVATCLSSDGTTVYNLGFDPRNREWRCTCAVPGKRACSHLAALRLVVDSPQT
jgi:hypothetical protein